MWHGTGAATRLQNGKTIPVVVLSNYMEDLIGPGRGRIKGKSLMEESGASVHRGSGTSCFDAAECLDKGALGEILERAGEERFMAKAAVFEAEFDHIDAGQVLYQGIMCALGYSRNKLPFLELARRLPLKILESIVQQNVSDEECLARQQALLLGVAGLLPSTWQREYQGLELDSQANVPRVRSPWPVRVMSATDWQLFKVRPSNSPVRRIAAMSYLVLRCRERGMLEELIDVVKRAPETEVPRLGERLIVTAGGYRAGQFDFGGESRAGTITLLGAERAAVIMVNIILPFACAWSRANSRPELGEKALRLYRHYPRLGENTVERHMREQLGLSPFLVNSACRQQGLIHVYKTLCVRGRCNSCPVSQNVSHAYHECIACLSWESCLKCHSEERSDEESVGEAGNAQIAPPLFLPDGGVYYMGEVWEMLLRTNSESAFYTFLLLVLPILIYTFVISWVIHHLLLRIYRLLRLAINKRRGV
jgi:hypothetical protein